MTIRPVPPAVAEFTRAEMARLNVPGVAVGYVIDGAQFADGFGVTNVAHPLQVSLDTQFQIGSTSKTFTASVAMMLVEAGQLALDAPVRTYLPRFSTSSEVESSRVTLRHLLTHHTGWPGDYFKDFGRGDDALARYVDNMARAPQQLRAGEAFSYCNSAFYVLARVIEVVAGAPFEQIVMQRLIAPLGMALTTYFPEDVLGNRVAAGHLVSASGARVARPWHMARCLNGGGGVIASVADQLLYAQFHLDAGVTASGHRLLDAATVADMQAPHAQAGSMCDAYGLGWMLDDHNGVAVVKHGGATNGFLSAFELIPAQRFGCTVLTNADTGRELRDSVAGFVRREILALPDRQWTKYTPSSDVLAEYTGTYRAIITTSSICVSQGTLQLLPRANAAAADAPSPEPVTLTFHAPDRTVVMDGTHRGARCEFVRDATGKVTWLRWDGRLARRETTAVDPGGR
jgi:CubicO group peptidase (beta-lactamase class C family)